MMTFFCFVFSKVSTSTLGVFSGFRGALLKFFLFFLFFFYKSEIKMYFLPLLSALGFCMNVSFFLKT